MSANRSRSRPLPRWWLGGREKCGFCLQLYALEMETRCVHCDRPVCPMCVTEVKESRLLHGEDGVPVKQRMVNPRTGETVEYVEAAGDSRSSRSASW